MVESIEHKYSTQSEMESIMGTEALMNFSDDLGDRTAETDVVDNSVIDATDEVNFYLEKHYDPVDMVNNRWVRRTATYLACFFITARKADPGYYAEKAKELVEKLQAIASRLRQVPRLTFKEDLTPSMSNLRVSDRFITAKIRVLSEISTGGTSGKQHLNPYPGHYYI